MGKKDCPEGQRWDRLLMACVTDSKETRLRTEQPRVNLTFPSEPPMTAVGQLRATEATTPTESMMALNPFLWIFVVLATLGSILALALWFIIYRRQTRRSSTPEEALPALELLHNTDPPAEFHSERNGQGEMFQRAAETSSLCHHQHLGAQTGTKWEDNFNACRGPAGHAGPEGGGVLSACSTMVEHRIPLPATELGGTALVTTKTV
ncbi:uncharacterized protein LOC110968127 isoform X2 [Acanthochromis polyacanthus]|uniref:uncharacterized protein LOC110968127 isoform X2 n=1 Tax=Acanthochromis polyacanthus TaxID=80966 RepID=UPI000B90683F|nr:uncharacterized protein LOC110968127 isoform X2 [Acanthochromis polyacanthus]